LYISGSSINHEEIHSNECVLYCPPGITYLHREEKKFELLLQHSVENLKKDHKGAMMVTGWKVKTRKLANQIPHTNKFGSLLSFNFKSPERSL